MRYGICLWLVLVSHVLIGQNLLRNGSFEEGVGQPGRLPRYWINAGQIEYSPPDVHTVTRKHFGVLQAPADGKAYVGLVARADFSFEAIAQRIKPNLMAGTTYELTLTVCHSTELLSLSGGRSPEYFDAPVPFDVYVSNTGNGSAFELVHRSAPVDHADWRTYTVRFTPARDWKYLRIGSGMNTLYAKPPNGNILVDNVRLVAVN